MNPAPLFVGNSVVRAQLSDHDVTRDVGGVESCNGMPTSSCFRRKRTLEVRAQSQPVAHCHFHSKCTHKCHCNTIKRQCGRTRVQLGSMHCTSSRTATGCLHAGNLVIVHAQLCPSLALATHCLCGQATRSCFVAACVGSWCVPLSASRNGAWVHTLGMM